MRLMIASDIHGSSSAMARFAEKVGELKPETVLILGDILYHGPRNPLPDKYLPAKVITSIKDLPTPIVAVRGNCDAEVDQLVLPVHLAESAWLLDGTGRIMVIHGHQLEINGGSIKAPEGAAVLSGHTHVPTAEKRGRTHYWNPGSLSLPKENFPPSFGQYEDGKFEVLTFDGQTLMSDMLA